MPHDNQMSIKGQRADADERAASAWRLRVAGAPWEAIAKQLGYADATSVHRAVKRYFGVVPQVDRDMLRAMARQRGEHLWLRAFQQVEASNGSPAAIRAAVEVLRRHAALDGLDAPTRVEVREPDAVEFRQFIEAAAVGMGVELPVEANIFSEEYMYAEIVEDDSPA